MLLSERLYRYANNVRVKAEKSGKGSVYPEIRQCARALRVKQADIEQAAEDAKGWGLPLDVSIGVQGNGGYGVYDRVGDYQIETWDEEQ